MKDRVTLTIDRQLLKQIDSSVDGRSIKNRSHAVELLIRRAMDGELPGTGVILAGSTDEHLARVLAPMRGKPVIVHNVRLLLDSGVRQLLIVSARTEEIKAVLDAEGLGDEEMIYLQEASSQGTAGALRLAATYIDGPFILTNGDEYKEISIRDMYAFHRQHGGTCTIALTTVPDPTEYGVALLNGNRIVTFVEKPSRESAPSNLISAGLYIMEPDVLEHVPDGYGRIEIDIFPKLAREDQLYGYHFSGAYEDEEQ